jgi:hypothetical protein
VRLPPLVFSAQRYFFERVLFNGATTVKFSITILSIKGLYVTFNMMTLSITELYHYAECCNAECRILFIFMLSVVMLSVIVLSVVILRVIMLSVVMLSIVMLIVIMLSVVSLY